MHDCLPKDYYYHEAAHHRLIGERTHRVFRLGDKLKVRVSRVNLDERKIDFDLVEEGRKKGKKDSQMTPKALKLAAEYEEARAKTKKKSAKKTDGQPGRRKKASSGKLAAGKAPSGTSGKKARSKAPRKNPRQRKPSSPKS